MLWDTAGQEEFDALTKAYYRGAQVTIVITIIIFDQGLVPRGAGDHIHHYHCQHHHHRCPHPHDHHPYPHHH